MKKIWDRVIIRFFGKSNGNLLHAHASRVPFKKYRRWHRVFLAVVYIAVIYLFVKLIVVNNVIQDFSNFPISKEEQVVFGVSIENKSVNSLSSEYPVRDADDWGTSFLMQSQSPVVYVFLDSISLSADNDSKESNVCFSSIHLAQNEIMPLDVFANISIKNELGTIVMFDDRYPNRYSLFFNEKLCLEKNRRHLLPHLFLGIVSSNAFAELGLFEIKGNRAFDFFPFEEQNILLDVIAYQETKEDVGGFVRPSVVVTTLQPGWIGRFSTNENGLTNLNLSRPVFYKYILLTFFMIMIFLIVLLNNIIDLSTGFFEVSFGLLLGLWGTYEILVPEYIKTSTAIDILFYILYLLVLGEITVSFIDEILDDWVKRFVVIDNIVKGGYEEEGVVIRNKSIIPIDMTSWILFDESGHKFKFPRFILGARQGVKIWTARREKVVIHTHEIHNNLFWEKKQQLWNNSRDTAYLEDAKGEMVDQFPYGQDIIATVGVGGVEEENVESPPPHSPPPAQTPPH